MAAARMTGYAAATISVEVPSANPTVAPPDKLAALGPVVGLECAVRLVIVVLKT